METIHLPQQSQASAVEGSHPGHLSSIISVNEVNGQPNTDLTDAGSYPIIINRETFFLSSPDLR